MKKNNQNAEVYKEIMETGKSLLQLYMELKEKCDDKRKQY